MLNKENFKDIEKYYPRNFAVDLANYCASRNDAIVLPNFNFPESHRRIRIGGAGFETLNTIDFYFCFYFIVLTDMCIHSHFEQNHYMFDKKVNPPKIFGWGWDQRMEPYTILHEVKFKKIEEEDVIAKWNNYAEYFILREWIEELPKVCGISGIDFMVELLSDEGFNRFPDFELTHSEFVDGTHSEYVSNSSNFFENLLKRKIENILKLNNN